MTYRCSSIGPRPLMCMRTYPVGCVYRPPVQFGLSGPLLPRFELPWSYQHLSEQVLRACDTFFGVNIVPHHEQGRSVRSTRNTPFCDSARQSAEQNFCLCLFGNSLLHCWHVCKRTRVRCLVLIDHHWPVSSLVYVSIVLTLF